ncbi:globin domain-containing protein [Salisediminibacterium beveridgei]|uniref:Group 2 truncated hemoglobin yjbI n=1 Tax=Salisediminibacterium beveridgei TaxID=632773 RepID=A0A1D7QWI0_9BACI|nr:globin [Salisediminibacterium beveridgei]AOM83373.1 Group 2 truncated hemoglobin yjbI [Salisediminibacterium beveridgei]
MSDNEKQTLFERIGESELHLLIERFYTHVQKHPDISDLFPEDMSETIRKQKQFLTQFSGGPDDYTMEHGHPMLRMRHMPFHIGEKEADAWLSCMHEALLESAIDIGTQQELYARLSHTAKHMINHQSDDRQEFKRGAST